MAYHDMLEHIEQQFGGEAEARKALGYSKGTADRITVPANDRRYFSRHPGSEAPIPVPDDVVEGARSSADEVLRLFVRSEFTKLR